MKVRIPSVASLHGMWQVVDLSRMYTNRSYAGDKEKRKEVRADDKQRKPKARNTLKPR